MKLTQTVKKGGCAAKVPAAILRSILQGVQFPPKIEGLLVDGKDFDDAAIYRISDDLALVQTLDFFTPIVDDPYDFGAVAAANALSDVYAMGGRPKTCMAILAAPLATMEEDIIRTVLQGAADTIALAGASLVGGHSIDDDTLKFGLSVTGLVHPRRIWTNAGARPGDVLVLTKALGTGTLCAAIKRAELADAPAAAAIASMRQLNNVLDHLGDDLLGTVHAATDVTGFGLAGHGYQLARASGVTLELSLAKLPVLPQALECLALGLLTKAHRSNEEYTKTVLQADRADPLRKLLCFDPQTSGGLLLSVAPDSSQELLAKLRDQFPQASIIGSVGPRGAAHVVLD
jgi:selenide,water dikinase